MSDLGILVVCTGNVCRSPAAELLLADALAPAGVRVASAGTDAPVGAPVSEQMAVLPERRGLDPSGHRARALAVSEAVGADLVLGLTREHRGRVVELAPAALRRTFTLLEFSGIAAHLAAEPGALPTDGPPSARLRALVDLAPRYRQVAVRTDIEDPIGRDDATYERVFAEISQAVTTIAATVAGSAVGLNG